MRRAGHRGGYTLIEVVMVLAVLAVACAVITPAVGRTVDGVKVRTEVAGVASFLRRAREQAVTRGEPYEVALDSGARTLLLTDRAHAVVTGLVVPCHGCGAYLFSPRGRWCP